MEGERQEIEQEATGPTQESKSVAQPPVGFMAGEPRPVKHLDPSLMRKLKRKTPFKSIAERVRRSFSDFAKRSTTSILTIFPPLGDGTNEGFSWDSYSDGEYDSDEWAIAAELGSSIFEEEDVVVHTLSPPDSPEFMPIQYQYQQRHRRLSSGNSLVSPDQYWPGSVRLGFSDDGQSPTNPTSPSSVATPLVPTFGTQIAAMSRNMSPEGTSDTYHSNTRVRVGEPRGAVEPVSISPVMGTDPYFSPLLRTRSEGKVKRPSSLFRKNSQVNLAIMYSCRTQHCYSAIVKSRDADSTFYFAVIRYR